VVGVDAERIVALAPSGASVLMSVAAAVNAPLLSTMPSR
jgi:hypothetical protein